MSCNLDSQELVKKLEPYKDWIQRIEEVLLFKRPVVFVCVLIFVYSLFGFAKSVDAGFFASICLMACAFYVLAVIYAYAGDFIINTAFKPLEDTPANKVPTLEELAALLGKYLPSECPCKKLSPIVTSIICIVVAIFFRFVPPFWFNIVITTIALVLPGILYIVLGKKDQQQKIE